MISGYNLEMLYKHDNAAKRYLGDYWGCGGGGGCVIHGYAVYYVM